jgi:hypothetical protein
MIISALAQIDLQLVLVDRDPLPGPVHDVVKKQCLSIKLTDNAITFRILQRRRAKVALALWKARPSIEFDINSSITTYLLELSFVFFRLPRISSVMSGPPEASLQCAILASTIEHHHPEEQIE